VRIPFDSVALRAVISELRPYLGARVQRILQPSPFEVVLTLYSSSHGEAALLLSCDPVFARAHLVTQRSPTLPNPPAFVAALRARIEGSRLVLVEQVGFDRILHLGFEGETDHMLICELMGKHANLILVEPSGKIVQAAKSVGPSKSVRPITSGRTYEPPPFPARRSVLEDPPGDEGLSPFLAKWLEAGGSLEEIRAEHWHPVRVADSGAYPLSVARLALAETPFPSFSQALEVHFREAIYTQLLEQRRTSLAAALRRVKLARETALRDLYQARDTAGRAAEFQLKGELILAYGYAQPGAATVEAIDYEGNPVSIKVDPALSPPENAEKFFAKAKKSRSRIGLVHDQIARLEADLEAIEGTLLRVGTAKLGELETLSELAKSKRWVQSQSVQKGPTEKAFEGQKVRELTAPHGFTVLYGESATANDYLTQRVARPEDWWLHVRGHPSAHVIVQTQRKPDRVPFEVLIFAAKIAVQNSNQKHARHVDVDYTLKKYVRKPRGSAPGQAFYTHEKTITVE
jgi:predicted ribosome quality control (RQC) complex YloA/Tae2 family protein